MSQDSSFLWDVVGVYIGACRGVFQSVGIGLELYRAFVSPFLCRLFYVVFEVVFVGADEAV